MKYSLSSCPSQNNLCNLHHTKPSSAALLSPHPLQCALLLISPASLATPYFVSSLNSYLAVLGSCKYWVGVSICSLRLPSPISNTYTPQIYMAYSSPASAYSYYKSVAQNSGFRLCLALTNAILQSNSFDLSYSILNTPIVYIGKQLPSSSTPGGIN
jgi:hypothetical protein